MSDATSVLYGLETEFRVVEVTRLDDAEVKIVIEMPPREGPCPSCGVLSSWIKDRAMVRVKDVPASGQRVQLWWRKRRLICTEMACRQRSFTQLSDAIRPRARLTERLKDALARAIASSNRAVAEVASEYGVSWGAAHRALAAAAVRWLPEPTPTRVLGLDETRARSMHHMLAGIGWRRLDPWLTSFVDCSRDGPGSLVGLTPGRTGAAVQAWLAEQTPTFRDAIKVVVIDTSSPYAGGIRAALPHVQIAVDKWHLITLANQMVTTVRQRVTRHRLGRRGRAHDPMWVNRQLLLLGANRLSAQQRERLIAILNTADPSGDLRAAWQVKEQLRMLLAEHQPSRIRGRLADFYEAAVDPGIPETIRLAKTIQAWWPAILVALTENVTNARSEGFNRIIKQTKRVGCGYRNMINYQRRILTHIAVTRPRRPAA
jgi:transposase